MDVASILSGGNGAAKSIKYTKTSHMKIAEVTMPLELAEGVEPSSEDRDPVLVLRFETLDLFPALTPPKLTLECSLHLRWWRQQCPKNMTQRPKINLRRHYLMQQHLRQKH